MIATLINAFIIPEDKEEEFLESWKKTTDYFSRKKGFLETKLHRNSGVGDQTFMYVNVAKWESKEAWDKLHREYMPSEYNIEGVKGHAACFDPVIHVKYQGNKQYSFFDFCLGMAIPCYNSKWQLSKSLKGYK